MKKKDPTIRTLLEDGAASCSMGMGESTTISPEGGERCARRDLIVCSIHICPNGIDQEQVLQVQLVCVSTTL